MNSESLLESVLASLITLLDSANETDWRHSLENFKARWQVITSVEEWRELLSEILRIYGGIESFSDLVLYRGDKILTPQTQKLDQLRMALC
jgi:hypothetical protein